MTATVREQIAALSVSERVLLVEDIWDSVLPEVQPNDGISDAQRAELRRRVEQHQENPQLGESWQAVKDELRRKP